MKIYLLYSTLPGKEGYMSCSTLLNPMKIEDFKYDVKYMYILTNLEDAQEEKRCMIAYLTNPDKKYRAKDGDLEMIKSIEIHEIDLYFSTKIYKFETNGE